MKRYTKTKYDQNHSSICADLRKQGVDVLELLDPVDTCCKLGDYTLFIELKIEGSAAKYTRKQLKWISSTKMNVVIAKSSSEAMHYLKTHARIGDEQKERLAKMLLLSDAEYFQPSVVEAALNA